MRARPLVLLRIASIAALGLMASPGTTRAGVGDAVEESATPRSLLGSYLAGRVARGMNDTPAAATYYGQALTRDPDNQVLVEYAFQMEASEGNWARVETLANELIKSQPTHRTARAFLGIAAFKAGRYAEAEAHFTEAGTHPIGELTSTVARAWIAVARPCGSGSSRRPSRSATTAIRRPPAR